VSYINIHKVEIESEGDDEHAVPMIGDHNLVTSRRDGEEISACAKILSLLDDLDNGEAIVIRVENF
jgi:hypothetical protein